MFIEGAAAVRVAACAALVGLLLASPGQAQEAGPRNLGDALREGSANLSLRYRLEYVDDDSIAEDAEASTMLLRLNYGTATFENFSAFVEFDYVAEVLWDDYNSGGGTSPARTQYPVVADPDGGDLNQLYVDFTGFDGTLLRLGRQRIVFDNQRFVGGVAWRQNEQTFDGVTAVHDGIAGVKAHYTYVTRVNRIFGDRSPVGRSDSNTHLLNVAIELPDDWTLTPYAYLIDDDDLTAFSSLTLGGRLLGAIDVGERKLALGLDVATQSDAGSAPQSYRAGYLRFDANLAVDERLSFGLGYELLDGDQDEPGEAFRTPLSTLHLFQGWADQFLATPDAGVEDLFVTARFSPKPWTFNAIWHRFAAADGPADWGNELDLSLARPLGNGYGLLLKAAFFDADDPAYSNVSKLWLMLTASF